MIDEHLHMDGLPDELPPAARREIVEAVKDVLDEEGFGVDAVYWTEPDGDSDSTTMSAAKVLSEETGRPHDEFVPEDVEVPDFDDLDLVETGEWERPDMLECVSCGYVSQNDEIGRDEPSRSCPECGGRMFDASRNEGEIQ